MSKNRSYRLLCPIARALDVVGDRWTLLILRDLHAGPARFGELQSGLSGMASNLLASRLRKLEDDGLIERVGVDGGVHRYGLTERGEATAPLLFELATYGSGFAAREDVRRPGNLRTVAVTLKESLRRVVDEDTHVRAELVVDEEAFSVSITGGQVTVAYGGDPDAPVSTATDYPAVIAVLDGDMELAEFGAQHVRVLRGSEEAVHHFTGIMARAFAV